MTCLYIFFDVTTLLLRLCRSYLRQRGGRLHVWCSSSRCFRSGMLESGVDRIITQVVDPKMNHTFRPHIETAIHDFLSGERKEDNAMTSSAAACDQTEPPEVPSATGPRTPWGLGPDRMLPLADGVWLHRWRPAEDVVDHWTKLSGAFAPRCVANMTWTCVVFVVLFFEPAILWEIWIINLYWHWKLFHYFEPVKTVSNQL